MNIEYFKDNFKDKVILITGGTGSFGNAFLRKIMNLDVREIRIFSRDEKKQDDMRNLYKNPKLKFYIGDVRDYNSIQHATKGVDYIFHAAALKQVPSCEFYPMEAVKTNIIGTDNVLTAAINNGVKKVVCLSTDKAVYPINAMGMSKALMEKVAIAKSRETDETTISITRYGNVMASRGSVIPLFIEQIRRNVPITITDPTMTRFMMSLDEAVELVLYAFKNGKSGDIFVKKAPAATIGLLAETIRELLGRENHPIKIIGTRHGEKKHETLITREEMAKAVDLGEFYKIPADTRDLNYDKYFSIGDEKVSEVQEYTSNNTYMLNREELKQIFLNLYEIQEDLREFGVIK
ncbi:polysaccharide biosynthesis protein capd [Thermosipho africanus H17ap60334]|jgi:UDP-glucose 4-epimerase|uniref:polysaccharide biosynthesis protein n=1 Tax=Thermosipho africanus TaxID=2421 RepID=UPI00028D10B9|nr:polysaccharide biosynthesis protein [Thermosipho africanus]EKF50165.1 polysaccharide biosynthesis protein capd [Thermosipho africanus H17ap60334]